MAITSFEKISRQVLMAGDPVTGKDGALYLDGTMTPTKMSEAIAEAIYVGEVFRNGQSVTSRFTVNAKVGDAVRVPLETPFPNSSRTLTIGSKEGTEGNGGIINTNAPMMPSDSEFLVFLNQVNDQMILFPDMSQEWLPLNRVATRVASYAASVVEDRSASILAEILAYSIYRSLNGADNLHTIDMTQQGAYGKLLNSLNTALDNGDIIAGAHTYPTEGRCIIGRSSFINNMFNRDSGVILTGSDFAQTMLKEYKFDVDMSDRDYVGNAYRGNTMQFDMQCAVDYIFTLAERYLGLEKGALDDVLGIAVSFDTTAVAENIDLGVKMVDHSGNPRGLEAQPLNCWGHEGFRINHIIGTPNLSNTTFTNAGFTAEVRKRPCAPKNLFTSSNTNKILLPILDTSGNIVGYREVANVPKPNGGGVQNSMTTVVLTLEDSSDNTPITGATITVTNGKFTPTVTEIGGGVYTFEVGQDTTATVSVVKTGYTTGSINLTKANTAKTEYTITETMTKSA